MIARSLLSNFGIQATVANARFCKPLDIDLIRTLCQQHSFLITVEEDVEARRGVEDGGYYTEATGGSEGVVKLMT